MEQSDSSTIFSLFTVDMSYSEKERKVKIIIKILVTTNQKLG